MLILFWKVIKILATKVAWKIMKWFYKWWKGRKTNVS